MASLRISVLFLGILFAGISGCGKTGPLYLPAEPATEASQADAPPRLRPVATTVTS